MKKKHNGCINLPLQLTWEQFSSLPASHVLKYENTQVQL